MGAGLAAARETYDALLAGDESGAVRHIASLDDVEWVADGDRQRAPLLVVASRTGAFRAVEALVTKGASLTATDSSNTTALAAAARGGHVDIAKFLLDVSGGRGTLVNSPDAGGRTPLHHAAIGAHLRIVQLLLARDAAPNAADARGVTPLHAAVAAGVCDTSVLSALLDAGALPNTPDKFGESTMSCASSQGRQDVVDCLLGLVKEAPPSPPPPPPIPTGTPRLSVIASEDLRLEEEIGRGFFGTVHRGMWNGTPVAVKQTLVSSSIDAELALLISLPAHPFVCQLLGTCYDADGESLRIVMELCEGGSLSKFLGNSKPGCAPPRRRRLPDLMAIVKQITAALLFLHKNHVIHRDLRLDNVLVVSETPLIVKLADFGMSLPLDSVTNTRGPIAWMSPSSLSSRSPRASRKDDVWMLGSLMFELFYGVPPFSFLGGVNAVVAFRQRDLDATPVSAARAAGVKLAHVVDAGDDAVGELHRLMEACWGAEASLEALLEGVVKLCG